LSSFSLCKVVLVPPKPSSKKEEAKSPIADVTNRAPLLKTPSPPLREASPLLVSREEEEEEENASVSFGNAVWS
jgi:hypothetical protein